MIRKPRTTEPIPEAFERRAARADLLAAESAAAREPLRFAAGLYRAQGAVAGALGGRTLSGRLVDDADGLVDELRGLLRFAVDEAPAELGHVARARAREAPEQLGSRLQAFWVGDGDGDGATDYLSRALLKPYVEVLAARQLQPERPRRDGTCPFCGGRPWIVARRGAGDSDGARRLLVCSLCAGEWQVNRIHCPACGEEDPTKLPAFHTERHAAARIEACESCRLYVKSIDLTIDARLIPEVDDLASLSLDLWAADEGFTRIEPGLAGV